MGESRPKGTKGEAVLAGLPHLLFAPSVELVAIGRYLGWGLTSDEGKLSGLDNIAILWYLAVIILVLAVARWRHWPRWSASWAGYALVILWIAPVGLDDGYTIVSALTSLMPASLEGPITIGLILLSFGVGLILAGRDLLSGLLVALPAVPMIWCWVDSEAAHSSLGLPLLFAAGVVTALASAVIVRLGVSQLGVGVVLSLNLLTRAPFTYIRRYHHDYLPAPGPSSALGSLVAIARDVGIGAILITGPVWGWALWRRARRFVARRMAA